MGIWLSLSFTIYHPHTLTIHTPSPFITLTPSLFTHLHHLLLSPLLFTLSPFTTLTPSLFTHLHHYSHTFTIYLTIHTPSPFTTLTPSLFFTMSHILPHILTSSQALKKAEQCQKQLYRAEEDRRQALATSEALTALWQKKFEKAQNENYELRQVPEFDWLK